MSSAVTFSRSRDPSQIEDDDIQITLAPYLQTYLAQVGHQPSCCPILFERASSAWWDPKFDSEILEGQYWKSSLPQIRLRFQYALLYIFFMSFSWCIYFSAMTTRNWLVIVITLLIVKFIIAAILLFTYTNHYQRHYLSVSITIAVILCTLSLILLVYEADDADITPVGLFSVCIEILLLLYTVIPLPLYICIIMGGLYSIIFEFLAATFPNMNGTTPVAIRAVLHLCIHIIGVHILIMTHVRMRGTFMKVGQSLLVRRQLEMEKQLKEKMIHSVMPPKVADWLMKEGHSDDSGGEEMQYSETGAMLRKASSPRSSNPGDIRSLFRPFNMHRMEDVSILFADIVGFTKMSSNKTAEQLVGLLNDLFERFDDLCVNHGCEKISTLGDCYYCVSGCPEPRVDHAQCCVEMGLSMITAIREFDEERGENINMRVGVHTGTVLCGIVGTKRFKFDVWSNDVSYANHMESTGMPGRVHISEKTYEFLEGHYIVEEGEIVQGLKTYFIQGRKSDLDTKVINPWLELPSPVSPHDRLSPLSHHIEMMSSKKACSLPSILDSDNDGHEQEEPTKSPTSLTGRNKHRHSKQLHPLKFPKRIVMSEKNSPEIKNNRSFTPLKEAQSSVDNKYHQIFEHKSKTEDEPVTRLEVPVTEDQLSVNLSINSRKDSGIRSNSRRSSIQQQIFVMNGIAQGELLTHRISGYYTSSQSTVNENDPEHGECGRENCHDLVVPLNESITCFHQLRKQSDLQLIKCVQDNSSHRSYFVKPPLSQLTLFFIQPEMEKEYRTHAHRREDKDSPPTLASSRFNTYFDILVSAVVYIVVSLALFILYDRPFIWLVFCFLATLCELFIVLLCIRQLLGPRHTGSCIRKLYDLCIQWYPWHVCGAVLVSLPVISVFTNFSCTNFVENDGSAEFFCYLFFVGLVHFCNFTQLNCWMKSTLASFAGILFIVVVVSKVCPCPFDSLNALNSSTVVESKSELNITSSSHSSPHHFHEEIVVDIFLLLCLVWFLNREFEISYRLSFHGSVVAARDKARVQVMKDQADWLLHNIIPKHVAEQLKSTAKYSENHKEVGIIFASIVNFNEMYDESYLGGKEYLRVLNELIGDFDELLREPQYRNVEKIKTIGSTFMAASGLNPHVRKENTHKYQHLFELMNFAINLQQVIDNFNRDLLEFNLILRIGYNHGDVTAGVIGTTKLYYDIWGDAVNIASRMDSTGVKGRIQVGEACLPVLKERYEFEPRGSVYVKGKDNMNVYLLKRKKDHFPDC